MRGNPARRVFVIRILGFLTAVVMVVAIGGVLMLHLSPAAGAYGADALRKIIGEKPVAQMEMVLFGLQDHIKGVEYQAGLDKPGDPFSAPITVVPTQTGPVPIIGVQPSSTPTVKTINPSLSAYHVETPSSPTPEPGPTEWVLPVISGQAGQPGANHWQPYLQTATGQVVAYRAYVYPDSSRPYAYTAIVAFDLHNLRLHYVLGTEEPYVPGEARIGKGVIPAADKQPGLLVAAFNGAFKYEHGHSGSMLNGLVTVPPRDGFGTVALYQNGAIKIGEWGKDIQPGSDLLAYRQNGPLVIQNGKINRLVDDPNVWGFTVTGGTVTFRSGMAISADQRTLYYFTGEFLTAPVLANAMESVHPQAAIQLDINDYWVYFSAVRVQNGRMAPEPLLPKAMVGNPDRFLRPYTRDFFYLTVAR